MTGLLFGLLWGLAYYFYNSKGSGDGTGGDTIPESSLGWVVTYWALFFILPSMLSSLSLSLSSTVSFAALMFCLPVIPSYIAARFRKPKIAFFFGRKCYVRFRQNPNSGGLYYGYLAAMKIADDDVKQESLQWLADQLTNKTKLLFSGDIVMFSILNAQLNKNTNLSTELRRLRWLPQTSIPKKVAVLAYKYALAEVLTTDNINDLAPITMQWGDQHTNRAAAYIKKAHLALLEGQSIDGFRFELSRRRAGLPKSIRSWLCNNITQTQSEMDVDQMSNASLLNALKRNGVNAQSQNYERTNALIKGLLTDSKRKHWQQRSQKLGVWDFDATWADYENRLNDMQASDENDGRIADEARYEQMDKAHKSLKYLEKSIERSLEPEIQGSAIEHLKVWFKVLDEMDQLSSDKSSLQTAFSNNYETLWNWAAGLWNDKKEKRLAYFIVNWCYPHAKECGYTDFSEVIAFMRGRP